LLNNVVNNCILEAFKTHLVIEDIAFLTASFITRNDDISSYYAHKRSKSVISILELPHFEVKK